MSNPEMFMRLQEAVVALDQELVIEATGDALKSGALPQDIISQGLSKGLEIVGERFDQGEFFLPELVISANVMKAAMNILRPLMIESTTKSAGKIILGTVQGDMHYIGKNIVGAVLEGDGFDVFDLGVDVPPEEFIKQAQERNADVVGMSALISPAVSKMSETIRIFKENNLQTKVIVGGAAVTRATIEAIGADAYGEDAWAALRQIRQLVKGEM